MKPTQKSQILAALLNGEKITPMDALTRFGSFRLGAVIHKLRLQGYNIITENVPHNGTHYARYYLAGGSNPPPKEANEASENRNELHPI